MQAFPDQVVGPFHVTLKPREAIDPLHREHATLKLTPVDGRFFTPELQARLSALLAKYHTAKTIEAVRADASYTGGYGWTDVGVTVTATRALVGIRVVDLDGLLEKIGAL